MSTFTIDDLNSHSDILYKVYNTTEFVIENAGLTDISYLPIFVNLRELDCSNNQLKELPVLPPTLEKLECYNNQLTELPALPPTLHYLDCSNNNIKYIDPKYIDTLEELKCIGNPLLPYDNLEGFITWVSSRPDLSEMNEEVRLAVWNPRFNLYQSHMNPITLRGMQINYPTGFRVNPNRSPPRRFQSRRLNRSNVNFDELIDSDEEKDSSYQGSPLNRSPRGLRRSP